MLWLARILLFIPSLIAGWFISREGPRFSGVEHYRGNVPACSESMVKKKERWAITAIRIFSAIRFPIFKLDWMEIFIPDK